MPIPSTPSIMPNVLGYAADTVQIPETTPTGQGVPSFRDLFPFITQVDPDAGGVMVERAWMNALFNLLGQHAFFQQSGCIYPWQATLNYIGGSHVKGSDDVEYIALQPSGPDVSGAGVKDPAQQANRAYWVSLASFVSGDFVPDSRRVIAGTGLTGGGPLSADVTLAAKLTDSVSSTDSTTAASSKAVKTAYDLANSKLPISGGTITGGLTINGGLESYQNINLTSDEANGLAIALYNTSNAILSSLRFKNNLITVEKGVFSADGVYSRGNMQLRTDDSNGLAIALYDLDGVSLYNAVRLKKDGTVSLEFQPLDISQGGTGARDAATARTNLFVPARPQNEEGPGQFTAIGVSAAQFTLPSGGSWAYSAIATDSSRLVSVIRSGVDAGGSTIYFGSNIAALFGFCWRWQ